MISITTTYTDLDAVFLNSGIQRGFDFSKPESVDISAIHTEFTTNYLSYIALMKGFLPFLQSQKSETALIWYARGLLKGHRETRLTYGLVPPLALHLFPWSAVPITVPQRQHFICSCLR